MMTLTPTSPWLLLHGTPLSPGVWDGFASCLDSDEVVRRPDLRAMIPATSPGLQYEDLQYDVAVAVAERLPATPHHVVGHSFGGQVALELALLAPDLVAGLTLLCTRDSPYPPFAAAAAALRSGAPTDSSAALTRWFRPEELAADGPMVRYARRCLDEADPTAWAATLDAIAAYDRTDRVGTLGMPVAVIAAGHDRVSTPAAMADMAQRIPNATFQVLDEAAHMSPFVDPAALAALVTGRSSPSAPARSRPD
jgi:3-oxoadipate enol-lactonase